MPDEQPTETVTDSNRVGGSFPDRTRESVSSSLSPEEVREKALEILRSEYGRTQPANDAPPTLPQNQLAGDTRPAPSSEPSPESQVIPARMLNEFVYCPRLFYYEHVENVFVESADTLRGAALHKRVDGGKGDLPKAGAPPAPSGEGEPEIIHSRSVSLGSERLGVTAKLDLVEVRTVPVSAPIGSTPDLFSAATEVCPVDYKVGAPREGEAGNELWPTDKMQLGLQALILRDNGYACREGIIYYRATKQRVRLEINAELEAWVLEQIAAARRVTRGPIPSPLVHSPKSVRCSLAPVCLPDETLTLAREVPPSELGVRRLMAAREDRRALYLNTPGLRVGISDGVLQVREKEKLIDEVRVSDVCHVALMGNIQVSTQAIQTLCEAGTPITYFSMGGWFYGITRGHELKNVFLRMEQFRLARDPGACLRLARQFVHGKIRNQRTLLMRNHLEPPEVTVLRMKNSSESALNASTIEELLGMEGAAASFYFEQFGGMLKVADELAEPGSDGSSGGIEAKPNQLSFNFTHRNRRPPTDPVNALLSLAYSMLAKDCTVAALAVGFDPYVGFYHQPRFGRPALALDLMEEFRPLVAESTVLSCINTRAITGADFVRAGQAVNLTPSGRKRFFQMYEQRMSALLTHPLFDYKVSYRRALELQARILARALTGEIPAYVPLLTR